MPETWSRGRPAAGAPPRPAPPGRVRVDCHLHTIHSGDAVTKVEHLARRVAEERLDVVCVTDHHTLVGAYEALEHEIGARVIVGEEVRTYDGEIIGLFLSERIPYVLPLADVVKRIKDQGGLVYAPHPLDTRRTSLGADVLVKLCEEGVVDAVETLNAKCREPAKDLGAERIARRYGLPMGAGSDAHDPQGIGAAYVEMPDFDGPKEFLAALHEGVITGEFRDYVGYVYS